MEKLIKEIINQCRAELLAIHLQHGDYQNALEHSYALRLIDSYLANKGFNSSDVYSGVYEKIIVHNLNNQTEEFTYLNMSAVEALISHTILQNKEKLNIDNPITRNRYRNKISYGQYSISLQNWAVILH